MNWAHIEKMLANCVKRRTTGAVPAGSGLGDYGEVLSVYDGIEGFVGSDQYLVLWKSEQIRELNSAYRVVEYIPGVTLLGTDGGDTAFGIDQKTRRYVSVPLVGMSPELVRDAGGSFEEFLAARLPGCSLDDKRQPGH